MAGGYTGKILRVNMTNKSVSTIDTAQYEDWGGGHGIGSAICWDLIEDKAIDGFDPKNIVTLMASPITGTTTPAGAGRCEVQGLGVYGYPTWFTRSNFGGRFAAQLKYAGWDGIVIEGAADSLTWLNIIDDQVTFEDAASLQGLNTWETQESIWRMVTSDARFGEWVASGQAFTTQKPAVVCISVAGENLARVAALVHDAGNGAGQGGFGGIFGAKKLKAISVVGTGSVKINDPAALLAARKWLDAEKPHGISTYSGYSGWPNSRPKGCIGCPIPCRNIFRDGVHNESQCFESYFMTTSDIASQGTVPRQDWAGDLMQMYGLNVCDLCTTMGGMYPSPGGRPHYFRDLYDMGILGPGKAVESWPLPMDRYGTKEFDEAFCKAVAYREGIGDDLAEGIGRAARKWGRYKEDTDDGRLYLVPYDYTWHHTLPTVEWTYGSLMGDRDINEHRYWSLFGADIIGAVSAEELVNTYAEKFVPYTGDPFMFNYRWQGPEAWTEGIYSDHFAKRIAWDRHYTRFYNQCVGYCDWGGWPMFINPLATTGDNRGVSPEAEEKFFNAVTGKNLTFAEGMEIGRRVWNLDRAFWILQGRHRDVEKLPGFMFKPGAADASKTLPIYENGEWTIRSTTELADMYLDEDGVENWKTEYYKVEGWDPSSGWPTRSTLEGLNLGNVADDLESAGKLGS